MMILLANHTKEQIDGYIAKPVHGVMIVGPEGAGKQFVAKYIAASLLGLEPPEKLASYPYFKQISPEDNSLKIDQIRELQKFLQLKTPGSQGVRRVIVVEDAHLMTLEAQNALLKNLEEPPADTVIILTALTSQDIKETIYSRVRRIDILPVGKSQTIDFFSHEFAKDDINKAYLLGGGHIGLMHALLSEDDHKLAVEIKRAKQIISSGRYERLAKVDELAKQKDDLPVFLYACRLICSTALRQAAGKQDTEQVRRWHASLSSVYKSQAALPANPNSKLLLTDLMLNL